MKFRFGIAGAHSTGKTTLLDFLHERFGTAGYSVSRVSDLASDARDHNFPILREHTFESTLWIIARGISLELEAQLSADVVLVDRPVADALGYLRAALAYRGETLPQQDQIYLETLVRLHSTRYSRLFKTQIDQSRRIVDDNRRDMDVGFRQLAANGIDSVFSDLGILALNVPVDHIEARRVVFEAIENELKSSTPLTRAKAT